MIAMTMAFASGVLSAVIGSYGAWGAVHGVPLEPHLELKCELPKYCQEPRTAAPLPAP
jgi:hypothetical protein